MFGGMINEEEKESESVNYDDDLHNVMKLISDEDEMKQHIFGHSTDKKA